jgi:hypothetical protein
MIKHTPLLSIYSGRECCGFIIERARGFEAFDVDERSRGIFASRELAINAACDPPDKQRESLARRQPSKALNNNDLVRIEANVAPSSRRVKRGDMCDGI